MNRHVFSVVVAGYMKKGCVASFLHITITFNEMTAPPLGPTPPCSRPPMVYQTVCHLEPIECILVTPLLPHIPLGHLNEPRTTNSRHHKLNGAIVHPDLYDISFPGPHVPCFAARHHHNGHIRCSPVAEARFMKLWIHPCHPRASTAFIKPRSRQGKYSCPNRRSR